MPFNGDPVLNANFFNGQHIIVGKVKMVVEIVSALATPDVGDEITTDTARAKVQYRFIDNDNRLILYLNDVNGQLETSGTILQNNITIGTYNAVNHIADNYHTGWWYINVGTTFNSTNLQETKPNLVVQNITLEGDTTNDPAFINILDTKQNEDIVNNPTRATLYKYL